MKEQIDVIHHLLGLIEGPRGAYIREDPSFPASRQAAYSAIRNAYREAKSPDKGCRIELKSGYEEANNG